MFRTARTKRDCNSLSKLGAQALSPLDWAYEIKNKFVQIYFEGTKDLGFISFDCDTNVYVDNEFIVMEANLPESFFQKHLVKFAKQAKLSIKDRAIEIEGPNVEPVLIWPINETQSERLSQFKEAGWRAISTKDGKYLIEGVEADSPDLILMSC